MAINGFQEFCDKNISEDENNYNKTDVISHYNKDISDDDKLYINSNLPITENEVQNQIQPLFKTTQYSDEVSGNYRKKKKNPNGKWLSYTENNNIEKYPKPTNPFFIDNIELYNMIYQYFDERVANFISRRYIELKKDIADYGQRKINKNILNDNTSSKIYELRYIDYYDFCVPHSKEFNKRNLGKKLEELFIEFQDSNTGKLRDQNKKIIKYIEDNKYKQLRAYELLELNFYELVKDFAKDELNNYLKKKEEELRKAYLKRNISNYEKRIEAYNKIIKILCNKFEDYSKSSEYR